MGALLLVRPDGRAIAIDLADTIENAHADETSGFHQRQVREFADKIRLAAREPSTCGWR